MTLPHVYEQCDCPYCESHHDHHVWCRSASECRSKFKSVVYLSCPCPRAFVHTLSYLTASERSFLLILVNALVLTISVGLLNGFSTVDADHDRQHIQLSSRGELMGEEIMRRTRFDACDAHSYHPALVVSLRLSCDCNCPSGLSVLSSAALTVWTWMLA